MKEKNTTHKRTTRNGMPMAQKWNKLRLYVHSIHSNVILFLLFGICSFFSFVAVFIHSMQGVYFQYCPLSLSLLSSWLSLSAFYCNIMAHIHFVKLSTWIHSCPRIIHLNIFRQIHVIYTRRLFIPVLTPAMLRSNCKVFRHEKINIHMNTKDNAISHNLKAKTNK